MLCEFEKVVLERSRVHFHTGCALRRSFLCCASLKKLSRSTLEFISTLDARCAGRFNVVRVWKSGSGALWSVFPHWMRVAQVISMLCEFEKVVQERSRVHFHIGCRCALRRSFQCCASLKKWSRSALECTSTLDARCAGRFNVVRVWKSGSGSL